MNAFHLPLVSQLQAAKGTSFSGCFRFSKSQLYSKSGSSFNYFFVTGLSALMLSCYVFQIRNLMCSLTGQIAQAPVLYVLTYF